jgi:serine/threonine-protein kinase
MGDVYQASDTKLNREVAIKVLPEVFAHSAGRMARFEREAKILASLNHPNIAHIYGVEERALVMELAEGESPRGPMPFDEAWKIAMQIADALEYAHEQGVVHRDLKPANIKVTPDGVVKLLDFGLAKAFGDTSDTAADDPSNSPTLTLAGTVAGAIMGTAAYMAPEQARGKRVDKHADIWSWGVVLYELLTGERMFQGDDAAETLAAVIHKQPELERVPPQVRRLLGRCLEKDPKQRLRDIGEARHLLEQPIVLAASQSRLGIVATVIASALAVIAAIAGLGWWRATRPVEHQLIRLDVDLGPDVSLVADNNQSSTVLISPDGTRLAYAARLSGGRVRLFTRRLDQTQATELRGTEGAAGMVFSPDGKWLGFFAGGSFNKISVEGGPVVQVVPIDTMVGASWGTDGNIIVGHRYGPLQRIPSGGGAQTQVTGLRKGEVTHMAPSILPGGKGVVFVTGGVANQVASFSDGRTNTLAQRGFSPRYLATSKSAGHLIYVDQGTLFAVPFDPNRMEPLGTPVPIFEDVAQATGSGFAQFDVSSEGSLVYLRSNAGLPLRTVQWLDATGKMEPLISKPGYYFYPRLSPDGKRLALSVSDSKQTLDIRIYDWQRELMMNLTSGGRYREPVWSPDGHYLVFGSSGSPAGLFWIRDDGVGQAPQPLLTTGDEMFPSSWWKDKLVFSQSSMTAEGLARILPVTLDSGQLRTAGKLEPIPIGDNMGNIGRNPAAVFSPDGQWLAYAGGPGPPQVFVQPASGLGKRIQISNNGGQFPVWSRASNEVLYRSGDQVMAVSYSIAGNVFTPLGKPRTWCKLDPAVQAVGAAPFDLTPDGKRIVVLSLAKTPDSSKADHEVVLLLNFFDYLRQKVPIPK